MMADFMQKCDMPYALSVFLPESSISQEILNKKELVDMMKIKDDEAIAGKSEMTPLLMDIIEHIKASG